MTRIKPKRIEEAHYKHFMKNDKKNPNKWGKKNNKEILSSNKLDNLSD